MSKSSELAAELSLERSLKRFLLAPLDGSKQEAGSSVELILGQAEYLSVLHRLSDSVRLRN